MADPLIEQESRRERSGEAGVGGAGTDRHHIKYRKKVIRKEREPWNTPLCRSGFQG